MSGLLVAEAAADAACGRPVYWLATLADAERAAGHLLSPSDVCVVMGAGDIDGSRVRSPAGEHQLAPSVRSERTFARARRRRPHGRRAGIRVSAPAAPAGVERDFSLARLTTVRTGGRADWFARAGSEQRLRELLAWARGAAAGGVGRRLGLEPARRRRGRARSRAQARRRAREHRRAAAADRVRRRRAPARAGHAGRPCRAVGDRVWRQHPGHGGRRGADERERLRRRARARARVGRRRGRPCRRGRHEGGGRRARDRRRGARGADSAARAGGPRPGIPQLEPQRPRDSRARVPAAGAGARRSGQGDDRRPARAPSRSPAPGDKDVRLDVHQPGRSRRERPHGRPAARGRGLQRSWPLEARGSLPSTPTSSRTRARPRLPTSSS